MKKIYLLLLLSCLTFSGYAQTAASYGFTAFSGTFTSISGTGTAVTGIYCDDCTTTSIPIGFTFQYCGVNYTQCAVCSNGFISLSNGTGASFPVGTAYMSNGGVGLLMPYWADLYAVAGTCSGTGSLQWSGYQTSGTAPYRTFTFEWKNWHAYPGGSAYECGSMNMQVILYETTNVIDFVYGSSTYSGMGYSGLAIGIANSTSDYQTLEDNSSLPTRSSSTFYYTDGTTSLITTSPATNQVYRWAYQCAGMPTAGTVCPSIDTGCGSSYTSVLSLCGASVGGGLSYVWQSSPDSTTWTTVSGLLPPHIRLR